MFFRFRLVATLAAVSAAGSCLGDNGTDALVSDRIAIEHVYYQHRTGTKPPFEQLMPRELAEKLVRQELQKEAVLNKVYGIQISQPQIEAEVRRINASSRAPEVLAELKAALNNDPARFAQLIAKPIIVERELRQRFENDDALHAAQRRQVEAVRAALLEAKQAGATVDALLELLKQRGSNLVRETTWQLGPQTEQTENRPAEGTSSRAQSGPVSGEQKFYFDELPPELQRVLNAQLRQAGDVSAVIETPSGFVLDVAKAKTPATLTVMVLALPKRSYEEWLAQQSR